MPSRLLLRPSTLLGLLVLLFSNAAVARDWFVASNGSDGWNTSGSINDPFASISRAFWSGYAGPGDTVYVRGGTYWLNAPQWVSAGGTAAAPLTLRPYPNETVILDGAGLPATGPAVLTVLASHVIVDGFTVRNSTGIGIQIWPDFTPAENVAIRNNTVHGCQKSGIFIGHKLDQTTTGVRNIQITGNTLYHNVQENRARTWTSNWRPTLGILYSQDVSVHGNRVYENYGEGISVMQSRRIGVSRNVVHDNYSVNLYIDGGTETRHEANLVYSTGQTDYFRDFYHTPGKVPLPASGIQIANESWSEWTTPIMSSNNVIINNIFIGNRAALSYGNYQNGGGLRSLRFAFNTLYAQVETALQIDPDTHSDNEFSNNISAQIDGVPHTWLSGDVSGFRFDHNFWSGGAPQPVARSASDQYGDPSFNRPGGYTATDYILLPGSPAVAAGQTLAGVSQDYFAKSRQAPPSLGASESLEFSYNTLIDHYYLAILGRTPDAGGRAHWGNEALRMQIVGVDVQEAFRVMAGWFFRGPEYLAKQTGDGQYVVDLYRTFFNRQPDSGGLSFWVGQLAQGMPRSLVLYAFLFSPEFTGYMQNLLGNTGSRSEVYAVVDFYRGFLNRLPDSAGLDYWLGRFRAAQCQGAAAINAEVETISRQFIASPEYVQRNRNNSDYVADLYYAFLRRGAEPQGFQYWLDQLNSGALSRDQERLALLQSPEFQSRVQQIIQQGCLL